jgi:hypothetical protein
MVKHYKPSSTKYHSGSINGRFCTLEQYIEPQYAKNGKEFSCIRSDGISHQKTFKIFPIWDLITPGRTMSDQNKRYKRQSEGWDPFSIIMELFLTHPIPGASSHP